MRKILLRLERLDHLIRHRSTGTPGQCASKLNISERQLYEDLRLFRELGAPVHYSRGRESYYYGVDGAINFKFITQDA